MPELPEVETIKDSLQSNLGARIKKIDIRRLDIVRIRDFQLEEIYQKGLKKIIRRGKFLALILENDLNIVVHMGMSGRFYILDEKEELLEPHIHLIIYLDNNKKLIYQDARRFGGVYFIIDREQFFCSLGREPLSAGFNAKYLEKIIKNRKIAIKTLILKQELISGIGNIYADEALFEAGIRPDRPAQSLSPKEVKDLCRAIKKVLKKSIEQRGTTFRDYRDGFNQVGNFQNHLKVYGKDKEKCSVCGDLLIREKIGGRSSHFCQKCQK